MEIVNHRKRRPLARCTLGEMSAMSSIPRSFVAALTLVATLPMQAAHAQSMTTLYSFSDILDPRAPLWDLVYYQGNLYGTSFAGGNWDNGSIYKIPRTGGSATILHSFYGIADGILPPSGLTYSQGNFYGATGSNGPNGVGTLYVMDPAGNLTTLYSFASGADGAYPSGSLAYNNGSVYGVTYFGGGAGAGTLYRLDPVTRAETVLHSFDGSGEGANPGAGPYYYRGNLYGTTSNGGSNGGGVLYRVNVATGAVAVLHSFGGTPDVGVPSAALAYCKGALYGVTYSDGSANVGTIYKVNPRSGAVSVVYNFKGGTDGAAPYGRLIQRAGILYGTTNGGGEHGRGTIFKLDPATGTETVLYSFTGGADGAGPVSGLTYAFGAFYGTTGPAGSSRGVVYKFVPG